MSGCKRRFRGMVRGLIAGWTCLALVATTTAVHGQMLPETYAVPETTVERAESAARDAVALAPAPDYNAGAAEGTVAVLDGAAFEVMDRYAPERFEYEALLDALDYEPERAFEFVRDEIRLEPYRGVLRGVDGALGAQAANAWDRSLLLKRLVEDMGFDARLAFGTLEADAAARLHQRAAGSVAEEVDLEPLATLTGLSTPIRQRLLSRATRDHTWLMDALAPTEAFSAPASPDPASPNAAPSGAAPHVWVQADLDEGWQDLDTAFAEASIGDGFAEPQSYASAFTADDAQSVTISVVAEILDDGELVEETVLSESTPAMELTDSATFLSFAPRNRALGGTLARALGADMQFIPILTVDNEATTGDVIRGVREERSDSQSFFAAGDDPELAALYVEVRSGPVDRLETARRVLLDRVPPAARAAGVASDANLAPLRMHEGMPLALQGVHQIVVSTGSANPRDAARHVGLGAYFLRDRLLPGEAEDIEALPIHSVMWPIAKFREGQIAVNERLILASLNDLDGLRFYIGAPRIYLFSHTLEKAGDAVRVAETIDLLHDPIHSIAAGDVPQNAIFERRLWHGVIQGSFETTLSELPHMPEPGAIERVVSASVSSTGPAIVIADRDDPRLPADAPPALTNALAEGASYVVAAERALAGGRMRAWWSIASDGSTRAMLAPSLGGSATWWGLNYTDARLPRGAVTSTRVTQIPSIEAHDRYARSAQRRAAMAQRAKNLPNAASSCRGGGNEYLATQCASSLVIVPGGATIALTLVAVAFVGTLYMFGYVVFMEASRGNL